MFLGKSAAFEAVHTGMCTEIAHLAFGKKAAQALRAVKKEAQRLEQLLAGFCRRAISAESTVLRA